MKRLFAVATGAMMLGATAMGAMAADLNDYPSMFVDENGVYDGYLVVGDNSAAVDNLATIDISNGMKYYAADSSNEVVAVEGDAWQVGTSAEWLELNESVGPSGTNGVVDYIDESDLSALADGEFSNSKGTFAYEQKLNFKTQASGALGPSAYFMEDEDDNIDVIWKISSGNVIAQYELDFVTDAESDIDASNSNVLKDFEDKKITFLGKEYTMTIAKYSGNAAVQLTFMGGSASGTLDEGSSQTYTVKGTEYDVGVTFVDADEAAFTVNGESTGKLEDGETFTLADGTQIGVSNILYQAYAGGVHQASFFLGADKLYLTDTDYVNDTDSSNELKVNEETIDGADVVIKGSLPTSPVSTTTDGELKLDYIKINMTAQDDIYMSPGDKLSEDSELEEPELLFANWDFEYHGIDSSTETHDIKLKKAGDDKYKLEFTSNDGNVVELPLVYATSSLLYGGSKAGDNFAFVPSFNITDDDYFVLNSKAAVTAGNSDAITTVLQYVSSKNSGDDVQTIKFKNINNGEPIERTFADDCTFDISLNGRTHTFDSSNITAGSSGCTIDNWDIRLTSTDYATDSNWTGATGNMSKTYLRDASGALIMIEPTLDSTNRTYVNPGAVLAAGMNVSVLITDTDKLDDVVGAASLELSYALNYTATNEVRATRAATTITPGLAWTEADPDDTDVTWGYTKYGSKLYHVAPSSTPQEFILTVPETSAKILAYVTSGATATSTQSGTLTRVEIVDASKLASEVADVSAQNLIVVGGPCANSVAAELMGNPSPCYEGFTAGKSRVKLFENANGNMAMLVAGYSGADTRLAGKVIAHRWSELTGEEVEIEGTTYSDATIGAPQMVEEVVEPEVVEPEVVEPETTE